MRALAVEDDPRIRADLAAALAAAGFRVETCADGEAAWFLGDTEDYDLIVLDLGLPKIDGLAVLKRWRAGPVLVLTARGAWNERVEGIDADADDYLPRPFHMEELVARSLVRRAAGRGRRHPGNRCADDRRQPDDCGDGRRAAGADAAGCRRKPPARCGAPKGRTRWRSMCRSDRSSTERQAPTSSPARRRPS
jgi:DNA-binding response OmpR family regulator